MEEDYLLELAAELAPTELLEKNKLFPEPKPVNVTMNTKSENIIDRLLKMKV